MMLCYTSNGLPREAYSDLFFASDLDDATSPSGYVLYYAVVHGMEKCSLSPLFLPGG